jgi:hypothetical protein
MTIDFWLPVKNNKRLYIVLKLQSLKKQSFSVIVMQSIFWSVEEVALRAKQFYENGIRQNVESGDNIGKMIVIDAETGEYGIDSTGVETALKLKQKNPNARLFTIRIGYDVAVSFGGTVERTAE